MNGVSAWTGHRGLPATEILRLSRFESARSESVRTRDQHRNRPLQGGETLLAAVSHPPRGGEPQPLAALVPAVLARYGISSRATTGAAVDCVA
jgi:hypothetical protein